ncbi:DUF413 domain-containing protein [Pontibacter sp. JAM-7]|uniref:DUF413 domain-containing protein n=1 Tax=Pontibacter sp. JAM-7 TaxID=3366581 RepID=UPI003AF9B151
MQLDKAQIVSFYAETEFKDAKNFPYGFKRSGEFTQQQAELLLHHGLAYHALHTGERSPVTAEESRFLEFCHGLRDTETSHERTWQRYLALCNKRAHRPAVSLSSAARESAQHSQDADWDNL